MRFKVFPLRCCGRKRSWRQTRNGPSYAGDLITSVREVKGELIVVATLTNLESPVMQSPLPELYQPVLVAMFMCDGFMWLNKILDPPGFIRAATEFLFSNASPMYYVTFFLIVFGFSYLDLQDTPKDVSEYMVKIGARIPDVRPGEATVRYLSELQSGSRFFGGLLLGIVAVACTMMDQWMKATVGISVGFTSMLIVVSTILQIQRQVTALAQMPKLDRVISSL